MSSPTAAAQTRPAGPPIDYSFRDLKRVQDLVRIEPASGTPTHSPITAEDDAEINRHLESAQARGTAPGTLNSSSVRVCNNHLTSLQGLDRVLWHVLDDPSEMVWLDASCNKLTSVDDVILNFPKLQVLYLHGNEIWQLSEVLKLEKLPYLRKLTLHGNPIAELKNYKLWVGSHLPNLRSLDFSTITKVDRDSMNVWLAGYRKQHARS